MIHGKTLFHNPIETLVHAHGEIEIKRHKTIINMLCMMCSDISYSVLSIKKIASLNTLI